MDTQQFILMQLEHTADWRRRKAEEFPDDERNIEAAELAEKLAAELKALSPKQEPLRSMDAESEANPDAFDDGTELNRYFGRLGFDHFPESAIELLGEVYGLLGLGREEV